MDTEKLGLYIKSRREAMRLSQEDLAQKLNVTQGYITKIETGKKTPGYDVLNLISKVFGVKPGFLTDLMLGDEESKGSEKEQGLVYFLNADPNLSPAAKRAIKRIVEEEYEESRKNAEEFSRTRERPKKSDRPNLPS